MKTYCTLAMLLFLLAACQEGSPTIPPQQQVHIVQPTHELDSIRNQLSIDSLVIDPQPRPQPIVVPDYPRAIAPWQPSIYFEPA